MPRIPVSLESSDPQVSASRYGGKQHPGASPQKRAAGHIGARPKQAGCRRTRRIGQHYTEELSRAVPATQELFANLPLLVQAFSVRGLVARTILPELRLISE